MQSLGIAGHPISVAMTQFHICSGEAATDNVSTHGSALCSDKTEFTKTGSVIDLVHGPLFVDPDLFPDMRMVELSSCSFTSLWSEHPVCAFQHWINSSIWGYMLLFCAEPPLCL